MPESVPAVGLEKSGKIGVIELGKLVASPLFRNRVTDIRLFYEGGGVLWFWMHGELSQFVAFNLGLLELRAATVLLNLERLPK